MSETPPHPIASAPPPRQGREKQRYGEGGERLVAGCVVLREGADGARECLLISSKDPSKWIFPKGGWETDETLEEAARRETLEEAGVVVELGRQIGWFTCQGKNGRQTRVCLFEASGRDHLQDGWGHLKGAEETRCRRWFRLSEAKEKCKYEYMRQVLHGLSDITC
eukprot:Tamp_18829.p1 GENE.Tamp_18829~~Tamp_18829.p1  ORF type:complete len:173 (+),score=37.87 Tamp_18829:22-519(+)